MSDVLKRLEPVHHAHADPLDVAYFEAGAPDGPVTLLLHGYPYDIHSYVDVIPRLSAPGQRVIVPYLRDHGPTRFLNPDAPRSGEQAAIGADVIAAIPIRPDLEAGFWYFYYFLTERGRAGLQANRREIARVIWKRNSPAWQFDDTLLDRAAVAFENPDYVEVVLHSLHRLGHATGYSPYAPIEETLAAQPPITAPAITLDGLADGNFPATDGRSTACHFTGPRVHHQVPGAGHNLPQESPDAFANAVLEVADLGSSVRT